MARTHPFALAGFLAALAAHGPAAAESMVDVASRILILNGDPESRELVVFGTTSPAEEIVVRVIGPERAAGVSIRRRLLGLWVGAETVRFSGAPTFHAVSGSLGVRDATLEEFGLRAEVSQLRADRLARPSLTAEARGALYEQLRQAGLAPEPRRSVLRREGGFFRAKIQLPPNSMVGRYQVIVDFLDGVRSSRSEVIGIDAVQIGTGAYVSRMAHDHRLAYGFGCVTGALFLGLLGTLTLNRLARA